jgi:hypothetical protein
MKPYTLIIVPRWLYDKHRPHITKTANWKEYTNGATEYMVACILTTHYLPHRDGLDKDAQLAYVCNDDDTCIYWHSTDNYDEALKRLFGLLPLGARVAPE